MKLYHGTAERFVQPILREGIKPRGRRKGNWKHTIESNPHAVYLTNAYPLHFAGNVANEKEKLAVLEVDTSKLHLLDLVPDEDFMEQATRFGNGPAPAKASMKYRTRWYRKRARNFQQYWLDSLKGLGTCCYMGTVPPKAITRVAMLDWDTYYKLVYHGCDPIIHLANYKICGAKYRNYTAWLFGDPLEPDPQNDPSRWEGVDEEGQIAKSMREWAKFNIDRSGVSVETCQ